MTASQILLKIETNTKREEFQIVQGFLERLNYNPQKIDSSERPDYEVEIADISIGIEVTKYFSDFTANGSLGQRKISEWKRFAEQLKIRITEINQYYKYLYGAIHFNTSISNYKLLFENKYFSEFEHFIQSIGVSKKKEISKRVQKSKYPFLSSYIESIYLCDKFPDDSFLWWDSSIQSGEITADENAIKHIVQKKEKSSKNYKSTYSQTWLLIYAGGLGLNDIFMIPQYKKFRQGKISIIKLDNQLNEYVYNLNSKYFSHIFIWDKFTEIIYLLHPYFKKLWDYEEKKIWINHLPIKI